MEKERAEREAKGLPPLTDEEVANAKAEKEGDGKEKKGEKVPEAADAAAAAKPPTGMSKGALDEMVKLGGRASPKSGDKEVRNRFASHLGAATQLNTIEEDLHET